MEARARAVVEIQDLRCDGEAGLAVRGCLRMAIAIPLHPMKVEVS
jgi:hypothetical protein